MEIFDIPDFLVSDRIKDFVKSKHIIGVNVQYYTPQEIKQTLPFFKRLFGVYNICELTNNKNKELYQHASDYAKNRGYFPPFPPLQYQY
jgi:hypothetical protein